MKYIVTGGAGFIGSHLCEELAKKHEVHSLDDYSSGYASNLEGIKVTQHHCDVSDMEDLQDTFKLIGKVDGVFHQAASKKNICLKNPMRDLEVNGKGAYNVASICSQLGIRMVHASTGSVYGEAVGIQNELHPTNPTSFYGISKLAGEKYARMVGNAVVLRYFHVYGTRQESDAERGGVLAIWLKQIKEGKPITLYGDGTQERSFTYVKDLVKANILAMEKGEGIYNAASGYNYTLNGMIEILQGIFGEFQVIQKDWLVGDIKKFHVDNSRIKSIGMKKWYTLTEGIKRML